MRKFYLLNWMLLLIGLISSTALGQTETITITQTSAGITQGSYDSGAERTWTQDEVDFGAKAVMQQSGQTRIQVQATNGIFYNTTPLPGRIVSVIINYNGTARTYNFYGGNSSRLVNDVSAIYSVTGGTQVGSSSSTGWISSLFESTDYTYFAIKRASSGASYIESIIIEYEVAPSAPTITTDLASLNLDTTVGTTITSDIVVTGTLLTSDINVAVAGDGFSVSPTTLGDTGGTVTVTYNPTTVGNHAGTVTLSNADADDVVVSLNGTATLATPVAIAATDVASNSFIANWNTVTGAESYEIDAYTVEETIGGFATDLFISEYVEGTSNNKYIEIYNGTGTTVDLSNYKVVLYANGSTSASSTQELGDLQPILTHGETIVLRNSSANLELPASVIEYASAVCNFNGDDAIGLYKNDILLDSFGNIGTQSDYGTDITLRRDSTIFSPNIIYTENEWASFPTNTVDNLGSHTFEGGTSIDIVYHLENENVGNVTSYEVTGLDPETTYYYVVRAVAGAETSANSNEIEVTTTAASTAVTWTTDNTWSNATGPTINDDVVIEGDLFVGEDFESFEAKSLTVVSGGSVYIESGNSVTVAGAIDNQAGAAAFVVENDANLIQVQDVANTGEFTVNRNSTHMVRNDMTLWSSPVAAQSLRAFSPETLYNRFWTYDEETNAYEALFTADTDDQNFESGLGYAIRVKNTLPTGDTTVHEGKFIGNLNNGTYTVNVSKTETGNGFNLVGNPYASSIDGTAFLDENSDNVNSVHFWTHENAVGSPEFTNNYLTYNIAGGTNLDDFENIASGQGFFVEAATPGTIVFNNEMRTKDEAVFHKNNIERNRVWLSLSSDNKVINNTLLAYMTGATNGIDKQMDAKSITSDITSLYQVINNEAYSIQSRSLPFDQEDKVALGFNAVAAGTYTISIAKTDGLFAEGQEVYLLDKSANKIHDLTTAYTFESEAGIFDERFEVVYGNRDLGLNTDLTNSKDVVVYTDNNTIVVESKNSTLLSVELIDLQGRTVAAKNNIKANTYRVNTSAKGVLVVKIQTVDGKIITKKVIRK